MGSMSEFSCPACGYGATVCGGKDHGFEAVLHTRVCKTCNSVVDVLIGRQGEEGPSGDPKYDADLEICPECRGKELVAWSKQRPCPRCGQAMDESPGILWD